jgi:HEAT repeat protein
MVTGRNKRITLEDELARLTSVAVAPRSGEQAARLSAGLRSRRSLVVARAASLIKRHQLAGFESELIAAFERFLRDPVKSDPSCNAKLALLEALDYGESIDEAPFLRAVRHVQMEPAWGPPVDTAASVRSRAILALARVGAREFGLIAAERLGDAESPVRQAACDALAHRGDPAGAPLALFKVRLGDSDPLVLLAAMSALV